MAKTINNPVQKEIDVFHTGVLTDSSGESHEWTQRDLETIAIKYNDKIKADPGAEAPVVKGHPETDDPAYGWVKSLRVVGDHLKANIALVPQFAEEVKDELFKKVSIALYPDLSLRHIGFLGAVQPAVKGLDPVSFAEGDFQSFELALAPNDKAQTEHNEAFSEFSIAMNQSLKRDKPEIYSEYSAEEFADPTHFRFPLRKKTDILASSGNSCKNLPVIPGKTYH